MSLDWLTARPIAHRGLHDAAAGVIENTRTACAHAVDAGYAIEVDLQLSADGEAMVMHDHTLDRLLDASGPVIARTVVELQALNYRRCGDVMMRFSDLLDLVAGRVPLVVELKSRFDGDERLAERACAVASAYPGPLALMSFDPALVAAVRRLAPRLPRGITAQRWYEGDEWAALTAAHRRELGNLLHWPRSRFQFVSFNVRHLPTAATRLVHAVGIPLITWTVRTPEAVAVTKRWADQMTFEGFRPAA